MATNGERNTQSRSGESFAYGLAATVAVNMGALVVLAAGWAKPGSADATAVTVGIAQESADNTGGVDGDVAVAVKTGTYLLANGTAGDALTRADIGKDCYVLDDETVAKTDGGATRPVAGRVRDVEGSNVWVTI